MAKSSGEVRGSAFTIRTTDTALHGLGAILNAKRRKGSTHLKVPADWLAAIVADHHDLCTALRTRKLLVISPTTDQESLKP